MTNEEAIKVLKYACEHSKGERYPKEKEAWIIAIQALETCKSAEEIIEEFHVHEQAKWIQAQSNTPERDNSVLERVGDCISREAVLQYFMPNEAIHKVIENLPPVQPQPCEDAITDVLINGQAFNEIKDYVPLPQRANGKWVEMGINSDGTHNICCGVCGKGKLKSKGHANSQYTKEKYKFCIECGADMRGEKDE